MKIIFLISALPSISLCFTSPLTHVERSFTTNIKMQQESNEKNTALNDVFLRPFGVILLTTSLVLNPSAVGAIDTASSFMPGSSSLHLAEDIKALDMSMPSYGSLSNPTAGEGSIEFVKVDKKDKKDKTAGKAAGARKKSGNNPLVVTKSKPMKEQRKIEPRVRDEPEKVDLQANFKSKPVFIGKDEVTIDELRQEKESEKKEVKLAKKEKQAVVISEEKQDDGLSLKDVKVVDMGMPSYGDSTTTKSKGVFAL